MLLDSAYVLVCTSEKTFSISCLSRDCFFCHCYQLVDWHREKNKNIGPYAAGERPFVHGSTVIFHLLCNEQFHQEVGEMKEGYAETNYRLQHAGLLKI